MSTTASSGAKQTLQMGIADLGFIVDRLGRDCHSLQFLRELTQNSIEAILDTPDREGEIVWDVDWNNYDLTGIYKLSITDTGIGMDGPEMLTYINHLSSSGHEQGHDKNFGVGAKVAAATRNHAGLIYLSWKDSQGWMTHLWRDPSTGQYGVRRTERDDGTYQDYSKVQDDVKPEDTDGHGTKVVLLGYSMDHDTMQAPEGVSSPSAWISRYLNTRYYRFPKGIRVRARQGWKEPRSNTNVNLLRTVTGQAAYLDQHKDSSGSVPLTRATAHWWILKEEDALTQNSGFVASSGHMAALYQDELYEMATGRAGVARLQLFGVIFGYQRVVMYVEPHRGDSQNLTSNTARTQLLMDDAPLPWTEWATEFRDSMPTKVKDLIDEVVSGATEASHTNAIKERLKQIRDLLRISRYRLTRSGDLSVTQSTVGGRSRDGAENNAGDLGGRSGGSGGRAGGIYALFVDEEGEPGEELRSDTDPQVVWISVEEGTRTSELLEDRAAKYLPDQNLLQINADFRVFTDMVERWVGPYSDVPGAHLVVKQVVHEWFEQALVETVLGAQALQGSPQWTLEDIAKLWSEEALTAAVLQRYHIDISVKRGVGSKLGSVRDKAA